MSSESNNMMNCQANCSCNRSRARDPKLKPSVHKIEKMSEKKIKKYHIVNCDERIVVRDKLKSSHQSANSSKTFKQSNIITTIHEINEYE